jgi:hypothetical protein
MRFAVLWLVATGCSFRLPGPAGSEPSDDDVTPDAAPPGDAPLVTCTTSDDALTVCLELEDVGNLGVDGSGKHHDAEIVSVMTMTRTLPEPSRAGMLGGASRIAIPDAADFNLSAFTVAAWAMPTEAAPFGGEVGVLDLGAREAAIVLDDQGRLLCYVRTTQTLWFRSGATVPIGTWSFLACTYQPPMLCSYVIHGDGGVADRSCGSTTDGAPMHTSSQVGVRVGNVADDPAGAFGVPLAGAVDGVRVYQRALSAAELCASGGATGC